MGRHRVCAVALLLVVALFALIASGASAATPSPLWTRCDGDPEDLACNIARGVATAPATAPKPGSVYVSDQANTRIIQYSAWGEFVRAWGWGVADGADEFQICTEVASCEIGIPGAGSGQFEKGVSGIAVDSAGNVYVQDYSNRRVQKFDPEGHFLLMFGGKVNKTKVEAAAPPAQQNLCTAASGDVCQVGSVGSGEGEFKWGPIGSFVAIGLSDRLYVGDEKRIQIFNPDGSFREFQPDPEGAIAQGTVNGLAIVGSSIFFSLSGKADVIRLNTAGVKQCTIKVANPTAVAARTGFAYVIDDVSGPSSAVRQFVASSCAETAEPFGEGEIGISTGIAVSSACFNKSSEADIYLANVSPSFARAYGPPPSNLELCPKPPKAPDILAEYALSVGATTATVRASINPHFFADTRYYVQYATTACLGVEPGDIGPGDWEAECVQEQPEAPGATLAASGDNAANTAGVLLSGLSPNTEYRFRFVAQSSGGGPTIGEERSLHTFALPSPIVEACPNDLFRSGAGAALPDCRAYEMVSPVDKDGAEIKSETTGLGFPSARYQSAVAGDKLAYTAELPFGDAVSQPFTSQYIASRGGGGWSTHAISPPRGLLLGGSLAGQDSEYKLFSDDLCQAWLVRDNTTAPPLAPGAEEGIQNAYRRTNCGPEGYRALGWGVLGSIVTMEVQGASVDGAVTLVRTLGHLAQDVGTPVGLQLGCETPTAATTIAYQWLRDGAPIAGKTAATYTTEAADAGKAIQCRVTATNPSGGATQVANPAWIMAPYPASVPPEAPQSILAPTTSEPLTVGGAGGQTLTCNPDEAAWSGSPSFAYRWYRNGAEIAAATAPTYTLTPADVASPAAFQCEAIAANAGATVAKTSENLTTSPVPSGPEAPQVDARSVFAGSSGPMDYLADGEGAPRTVCVLPDGTAAEGCSAGTLVDFSGYQGLVLGALSGNASRVYWRQSGSIGRLYLRENASQPQSALDGGGNCTEAAKACTIAVSEGKAQFWGASSDGSRAIYRSGTFNETGTLYEFDEASGQSSPISGGVSGFLGMSEDAMRVYFVSTQVLTATPNKREEVAQAGKPNLYLYDAGAGGSFAFITSLSAADAQGDVSPTNPTPVYHMARVSRDGGAAAFVSTGNLVGYDNTDANSGEADMEVYRYEATSGQLECVSCNPSGGRPVGKLVKELGRVFSAAAVIRPAEHQLYYSRALSDDGSRLFFESYEPLVLADTNGKRDVYQWEAVGKGSCTEASGAFSESAGGCVSLISSGKSPLDSEFADASPSGNDVFFRTASSLITPLDPGQFDVYDARVGGGFPQPEPQPPCEGDACQPPGSEPEDPTPASSAFHEESKGGASSCAGPAKKAKRLSQRAKQLKSAARHAGNAHSAQLLGKKADSLAKQAKHSNRTAKRCRARARNEGGGQR